jgi:large subunit ribosomal protein L17
MKKGRKLGRTASHRKALFSNLITSLIIHEKIRTTKAKAKEVRPLAEKMITFAKRGDLHARRQVLRLIKDKEAVAKLFDTLGERFKERPGGYTRILKLATNRNGDNAEMALLELVTESVSGKAGGKKRRRRSKKSAAPEAAAAVQQQVAAEEAAPVEEAATAAPAETEAPAEAVAEEPAAESEEPAAGEEKKV